MRERFLSGTALYYPYIHPRSVGHISSALLFWDRVRRIVPTSLSGDVWVDGDDKGSRLLAEEGLLVATSPDEYTERAAELFLKSFDHAHSNERPAIDPGGERDLVRRGLGIHVGKMPLLLLGVLLGMGVGRIIGESVYLERPTGRSYMYCLATEMSRRIGATLLADDPYEASLGQAFLFRKPSQRDGRSQELLHLGLELPSPKAMDDVPIGRVIKFSRRRAAERIRFRQAVEGILAKAATMRDANELEDYLFTEKKNISSAVADYRKTLREIKVSAVSSVAKLSVPAAALSTVALLNVSGLAASLLAGFGISVAAADVYSATRGKIRVASTGSPYHYLHSIRREFN